MKVAVTKAEDFYGRGLRLDGGYHASSGIKALRQLEKWAGIERKRVRRLDEPLSSYGTRRLDLLIDVCKEGSPFIPGRFRRFYVDDPSHGEPWLSPSEMQRVDINGLRFVSRKYTPFIDQLRIHQRYILLSRSGTIGNLVYVREDMDGLIGSDDIIRIIADPDKILPGYLHAYLSSGLGRALIEQKTYGAVVPHIEAHHIFDLPVPRLEVAIEQRIHELIEQAAALRVGANGMLAEAQAQLLAHAGLSRLTNQEALTKGCWTFTIPYKDFGHHTFTAWTYNPLRERIIQVIRSKSHSNLAEIVQRNGIFYGHQFKRIDADSSEGIELLSQSHVFQERPKGRWISKTSVADYRSYMVTSGTILVAAQGTMGDSELYGHCQFSHRNFENYMITQHILRIVPNVMKVDPGYLFAFLSSEYGLQLFRSTACGTKLLGFVLELVSQIPIPRLDHKSEARISRMVFEAYENLAEAIRMEDEAQRMMAIVIQSSNSDG